MVAIPLTKGKTALISPKAAAIVSGYTWHFEGRYAATSVPVRGKLKKLYMHRLLMPNVKMVDHINRNKLDNRFENLRPTSKMKNALNTSAKGATFIKTGKRLKRWAAQIRVCGKTRRLGYFLTEQEARAAYQKTKQMVKT